MIDRPNNFPREGQHRIVTRAAVENLERQRPVLNVVRHYTIEGEIETLVHSSANAEREAAIVNGSRRLQVASDVLRVGFDPPNRDGRAEYIRQQKAVAMQREFQDRAPHKGPSR